MGYQIGLTMNEQSCLFSDGFDYPGMAVTGIGDANAAGEIEDFSAIGGVKITTFSVIHDYV
jgi:hypothetical protein